MKIRSQFNLLILCIIVVPLFIVVMLPVYHYMTSPQRFLLKGYKEIRKISNFDLDENDWELVRRILEDVPPNMQIAIYYDCRILVSNIPELATGSYVDPKEFFEFVQNSSQVYDYQFQSPKLSHRHKYEGHTEEDRRHRMLIIGRVKVPDAKKRFRKPVYVTAFLLLCLFEAGCISIVIGLSRTVFSSITLLEESTQKIAGGQLDTKITTPNGSRNSNEITSLAEGLEKMRVSLKDAQERRTKFIMGISHDLRTPVALIKGYTEAITDGVVGDIDSIKKSLSIIHDKADSLESMINDLINYVKLNNTDWRQTLEAVAVEPLLQNFARGALATGEIYKRKVETDICLSPDIMVPMDRNLFNRALENIFTNAVRYTVNGELIRVSACEKDGDVCVSIADSGRGIAPKDLEHIWDIFYRGTNSRREAGMGIGLSVVKTIADSHGWRVAVESELDKGTVFTLCIPFVKDRNLPQA